MERAGLWRARLGAAAVDEALIAATTLLVLAMGVQTGALALAAMGVARALGPLGAGEQAVVAAVAAATWLAVRLAYGTLAEGGPAAATPGKRLAGVCVAGPGGAPPGYRRALARQAVKTAAIVSVVGMVAAASGHSPHDAAARTRVLAARHVTAS